MTKTETVIELLQTAHQAILAARRQINAVPESAKHPNVVTLLKSIQEDGDYLYLEHQRRAFHASLIETALSTLNTINQSENWNPTIAFVSNPTSGPLFETIDSNFILELKLGIQFQSLYGDSTYEPDSHTQVVWDTRAVATYLKERLGLCQTAADLVTDPVLQTLTNRLLEQLPVDLPHLIHERIVYEGDTERILFNPEFKGIDGIRPKSKLPDSKPQTPDRFTPKAYSYTTGYHD